MLQKNSPNLEELSIEGRFPHPIDAFQIANARWKNLRKINIGDLRIESLPSIANPTTKAPFIEFLEAHPKLQSLKFSRHTIHPSHFSHLGPETLPCVTEFSGTLEQLQQLPHTHPRLKSVTFLDPIRSRPVTTATMAAVLQNLPALVNLRVSFALHSMYDSTSFLRSLIAACPQLESLELTCSDVPSFQLVRLSRIKTSKLHSHPPCCRTPSRRIFASSQDSGNSSSHWCAFRATRHSPRALSASHVPIHVSATSSLSISRLRSPCTSPCRFRSSSQCRHVSRAGTKSFAMNTDYPQAWWRTRRYVSSGHGDSVSGNHQGRTRSICVRWGIPDGSDGGFLG